MTPRVLVAQRGRELAVFAAAGAVLLLAAYLVFELTIPGQAWTDQAYLGRVLGSSWARSLENHVLHRLNLVTVALMCAGLVVVGLVRRIWLAGLAAALALGLAVLAAEVLAAVLPHPDRATGFESLMLGKQFETMPSGHTTIACSFSLALLLVSSARWHVPLALLGTLFTTLVAAGVVSAGWHRPSDAIAGIGLSCAALGAVAAAFMLRTGRPVPAPRHLRELTWGCAMAAGLGALFFLWTVTSGGWAKVPEGVSPWPYLSSVLVLAAVAGLALGRFAWLLRDVVLAPAASGPR